MSGFKFHPERSRRAHPERSRRVHPEHSRRAHRDFVAQHLRDIPRSGIRDFFDIVSTRKDVISLSIGEPDFVTPWHIREASIFALDRGATAYTANLGLLELRQSLLAGFVFLLFSF